jgi:flavin reductase (DIM6/NTAB) family NADH-FMN oxidoreductase RutF
MKVELGSKNYLYPALVVVVGTHVKGKPNYTPVAHTGLLGNKISIFLEKSNYAYQGVKENNTFSVNIPSSDQLVLVDYCGLVSGREVDKGALFTTFYGELDTAPMIEECPINTECKVESIVEFETWGDGFVGEVVATYCNDSVLTEGKVDLRKVDPYFISARDLYYYGLGERIAKDKVGRELMKNKKKV